MVINLLQQSWVLYLCKCIFSSSGHKIILVRSFCSFWLVLLYSGKTFRVNICLRRAWDAISFQEKELILLRQSKDPIFFLKKSQSFISGKQNKRLYRYKGGKRQKGATSDLFTTTSQMSWVHLALISAKYQLPKYQLPRKPSGMICWPRKLTLSVVGTMPLW